MKNVRKLVRLSILLFMTNISKHLFEIKYQFLLSIYF